MRIYTRYRAVRPRRSSHWFYWVLVALCLGALGWIWWQSAHTGPGKAEVPGQFTNAAPVNPIGVRPTSSLPRAALGPTNPPVVVVKSNLPPVTNSLPRSEPPQLETDSNPRPVQNIFEAQLALDRLGISSGSVDGVSGSQTRAALRAFQRRENLTVTGELDAETKARLLIAGPLYTTRVVTSGDRARLLPTGATWLAKSQQPRLDYETVLELLAEESHAHPNFVRRLNPGLDWTNVTEGAVVILPRVESPPLRTKAAFIKIFLAERILEAYDANTNLIAHFPCSIAQRVEKRPVGELSVAVWATNPDYTFNPEVFPESAEARELGRKLILPPGPNNPVGVAWIGLDRPGYGIHGTPRPEDVGRTESHGCFRLANWNAEHLLRLVSAGTPVLVEP